MGQPRSDRVDRLQTVAAAAFPVPTTLLPTVFAALGHCLMRLQGERPTDEPPLFDLHLLLMPHLSFLLVLC
jgi:hypothetical protein